MAKIIGLTERQFERVANTVRRVDAMPQQQDPLSGPQAHFSERGVHWLNDSGEEIPDASIAVIDSYDVTTDNFPLAKLKKPYATFRNQLIITGPGPVEDDAVGFFPAGGLYRVKYDSGTPAFGEGWGPKPGQWTISKGFPGCTIRGILDSTNKIALVSLDSPIVTLLGKSTATVPANTSTTDYRIYAGTLGSEADAGFTTVPPAVTRFEIATGAWVTLHWEDNAWEMRPYANHAYAATLGGTLANGASTSVTLSDGRSVSATNYSGGSLSAGTYVAVLDMATGVYMLTGGGGGGGGGGPNDVLEGYIHSPFTTNDAWFLIRVNLSYNGSLAPGVYQQIYNYANVSPTATSPFLFQGEYGKCCRAEYDTDSAVYRVDWVECSPRAGTTPPSPGETATMYSYGGASPLVSPYYSG